MTTNPSAEQALGLATGLAFGALLQRGGLGKAEVVRGQFSGEDWRIAQTMGTAVVVGAVGLELLRRRGQVSPDVKPLKLGGVLPGATLFGIGMALGGYCPGTALTGAASGRRDARWALLGMGAGAVAYVRAYPALKRFLDAGDLGRVRIPLRSHG